ncbi:MAG: cytochrome c family protein [Bacteroidetes bacterium]|nr:cytochrome c family protein [Bacteroidota bacterium]
MYTKATDKLIKKAAIWLVAVIAVVFHIGYFGFHNRVTDVGYRPTQPVPFSHKLHAGDTTNGGLGIKCMYCHTTAEVSAHSPVPPTSTCMNCHIAIKTESPRLQLVRDSYEKNIPIEWRRVHKLPDYVNFDHSRHIRAMIDCSSCHGKVEEMGIVSQAKMLTMGWCLDCHRNPEQFIVPARPISGIFTGVKAAAYQPNAKAELGTPAPITEPSFGYVPTDVPKQEVAGIPMPKKPGHGPENCSACHY